MSAGEIRLGFINSRYYELVFGINVGFRYSWNDDVNLVGAFIPFDKGKAAACGTIKFRNGKRLSFSSQLVKE